MRGFRRVGTRNGHMRKAFVDDIHVSTVSDNDVLRVKWIGDAILERVIAVIEHQWSLGLRKSFWDLTRARTHTLSATDIQSIAMHINMCRPEGFMPGADAFLVSTALDYGIMRMVQARYEFLGIQVQVGRDLEMLEKWLDDIQLEP